MRKNVEPAGQRVGGNVAVPALPVADQAVAAAVVAGKKTVPVVFCADKNYGLYLPAVVQSIIDNSSSGYHYHIIVLDCGIEREVVDALSRQIRQYDHFSLHIKNIEAWLAEHESAFEEKSHLTKAMYGRLFIPELCRGYDKVIYADIDMVFNRDIAELMDVDLGNNYIGGVVDNGAMLGMLFKERIQKLLHKVVNIAAGDVYINSGLLIFNVKAWLNLEMSNKIIKLLGERRFWLPDQDAINNICRGKILFLEQDWNCLPEKFISPYEKHFKDISLNAIRESFVSYKKACASDKTVFHFTGPEKPWNDVSVDKSNLWWRYAGKTENYPRYMHDLLLFSEEKRADGKGFIKKNYITKYKFFGVPFLTVKETPKSRKYLFGKFRFAKKKWGQTNIYLYILGVKLFSIKQTKVEPCNRSKN